MDDATKLPAEPGAEDLEEEIADLEARLRAARLKLQSSPAESSSSSSSSSPAAAHDNTGATRRIGAAPLPYTPTPQPHHFLLLLSDSALPLGSFAFSSGLESFLHHHHRSRPQASGSAFGTFLPLSLSAHAGSTLPFVLAAHRNPSLLPDLDDALDATIMCTVGRRASVAQGRALLGVWEKAFMHGLAPPRPPLFSSSSGGASAPDDIQDPIRGEVVEMMQEFSGEVKRGGATARPGVPAASAHLPPLFGVVGRLLGLSEEQTAYVYLLGHVKALVSSAVRASVFGPYQGQKVLAAAETVGMINAVIQREWETPWEEAGQHVPMLDLWTGRHELLYSRIFNS